jgi:hypothetical protein
MKSPPVQHADDDAYDLVEQFIKQYGRRPVGAGGAPHTPPAAVPANGHQNGVEHVGTAPPAEG